MKTQSNQIAKGINSIQWMLGSVVFFWALGIGLNLFYPLQEWGTMSIMLSPLGSLLGLTVGIYVNFGEKKDEE